MKKTKRLAVIVAVLLLVVAAIPSPMHAESLAASSLSAQAESWYYPVLPGDEEWATLDPWEAYEVCNMPEHLLKVCSTERLAELLLDYPFNLDILAFNRTDWAFEHLSGISNIFREYSQREDRFDAILKSYEETTINFELLNEFDMNSKEPILEVSGFAGEIFSQIYLGENYLSLEKRHIEKLASVLEEKNKLIRKNNFTSVFSDVIYGTISNKMGLVPEEIIPNDIESYEKRSSLGNFTPTGGTAYLLHTYQRTGQSALVTEMFYYDVGRYGAYNTQAECWLLTSNDFSAPDKLLTDQWYISTRPHLSYVRACTAKYNCHFYAWIDDSTVNTNNMYWMNDPDPYCSVGSPYVNYKGSSNNSVYISSGDVIVLRDGNNNPLHSVIATSSGSSPTSVNTIAKMGCYGVFTGTLQQMIATYSGTVKYDVYET